MKTQLHQFQTRWPSRATAQRPEPSPTPRPGLDSVFNENLYD